MCAQAEPAALAALARIEVFQWPIGQGKGLAKTEIIYVLCKIG